MSKLLTSTHQLRYALMYEDDIDHRRRCGCALGAGSEIPEDEIEIHCQRRLAARAQGDEETSQGQEILPNPVSIFGPLFSRKY